MIRAYLALGKGRVSLLASGSALAGAVLGSPRLGARILIPWLGVLILACGAGALNQVQEWTSDARMERTRQRPVPSRIIPPGKALGFAGSLIALGLAILAAGNLLAAVLGIFALGWYNGVYTALKRLTPFAAVPGALTGAIPPAVGWVSAGGSLTDARLLMLGLLLFVWQVPHFWLLLLDRGREYTRAGLPALTDSLSGAQIRRISSQWILGTAACALLVSLFGPVHATGARLVLVGIALWLSAEAVIFRGRPARPPAGLFLRLNLFLVFFLLVLCLSRLLAPVGPASAPSWMSMAMPVAGAEK